MTVFALHDRAALLRGREYVICGMWDKRKQTFVTAPHIGIYAKDGNDRWTRQLMPARSDFEIEPDTVTNADLRARVENGSLNSVTRRSDVIVRGRVISRQDSTYTVKLLHGRMKHHKLQVSEVLKGQVTTRQIEFVIAEPAEYMPAWSRYTPPIEVGQEWLVFLKAGDRGLFPFAGRNSLLRIEEDRLIYGSAFDYPQTCSETIRRIRMEVQDKQE